MSDNTNKPGGKDAIVSALRTLPSTAGVYRMLDAHGDVLYVGKAKNLKKRVSAYTKPDKQSVRIQRMIALTMAMEFTVTDTEAEALLLEANLIKKLKPRYNILLRDDKSFPYILITGQHDFPQVVKHRGAKELPGEYFGPFASTTAVNETLAVLQKAFLLRNCSDNVFSLRARPCLQYQIHRCTAPCVNKVSKENYAIQVNMARQFLSGKSRDIQKTFAKEMQTASNLCDFETAALYRDRIRALTHIQMHQKINIDGLDNTDVHVIDQQNEQSCIQVFFFRAGQNFGNRAYFPRHDKDDTVSDILSAFIVQFYNNKPVPKEIIINQNIKDKTIIAEALKIKSGYKTVFTVPVRGAKKDLMQLAVRNAKEALTRRQAENASSKDSLQKLADVFNLDEPLTRIEVYDNSHISGKHAIGAMIVVGPEGFQKNAYRKFNMPDQHNGDDISMMCEMLTRRFTAALKNEDISSLPNLVLIDGGQVQLNAAVKVMTELGLSHIPLVAIAKGPDRNAGREKFFLPGEKTPRTFAHNDPLLYFLQKIRDEAHRFVITSHRNRRSKKITDNPLDHISGIGQKRKKALLMHFGSAKSVAEASLHDLQKVEGISSSAAKKIYSIFHSDTEGL